MSDRGNTTSDRTRAFPFLPASTERETGGLRFGLLAPLEVSDDSGPVAIGKRVAASATLKALGSVEPAGDAKWRAAECYASQLPRVLEVMPQDASCTHDEHYWRLRPR